MYNMEKYVTNISDLVISAMTIGDTIERKAKGGDSEACYQMGMIHLLGIEKPVSFRMAIAFFSNKSLSSYSYALRLLGFLNECDGNYSSAFQDYAKAYDLDNADSKDTYINKVITERKNLHDYLNKMCLPKSVMNEEISKLLDGYKKGKTQKVESCSIIASLCNDEPTCLEAAETALQAGDLVTARIWLDKGNVDSSNSLYEEIEKKVAESMNKINQETAFKVIDLNGNSLVPEFDPNNTFDVLKKTCDKIASESQQQWQKKVKPTIEPIIEKRKKEERELILQEQKEEEKRKERRKQMIIIGSIFVFWFFFGIWASSSWGFADLFTSIFITLVTYGIYLMFRTPKKKKTKRKR